MDTVVIAEKGRWAVDIIVVFADGVVRNQSTHPTQRRAGNRRRSHQARRLTGTPRLAGPVVLILITRQRAGSRWWAARAPALSQADA